MLLRSKSFFGSVVESANKRIPPKPQFWQKRPGLCQKSQTLPKVPNFARNPAVNNRIVTYIVIYNYLTTHASFLSNNASFPPKTPRIMRVFTQNIG
jgi:hypothetical protein